MNIDFHIEHLNRREKGTLKHGIKHDREYCKVSNLVCPSMQDFNIEEWTSKCAVSPQKHAFLSFQNNFEVIVQCLKDQQVNTYALTTVVALHNICT